MLYRVTADLVIRFHLVWIGLLIFGALLAINVPERQQERQLAALAAGL